MGRIWTVTFPDIGEGVVEGEVLEWFKQPGDMLKQDEPVVMVMTDKATVELPAPQPGKLFKQYYQPGQKAIKDKPLYDIELSGEGEEKPSESQKTKEFIKEKQIEVVSTPSPVRETGKVMASPPVRKLAKELQIDLSTITPTGKQGEVVRQDLIASGKNTLKEFTPFQTLPGDEEVPLIGIRNLMAKKMSESHAHIPHFSYFEQLDASRLVRLRERYKEEAAKQGIAVTYMPFIIRALSMTLKQYPIVNSSLDEERNVIVQHAQHHVGIAISTKQGLIVPVLKHVQEMSLQEIILALDDLKKRAVSNQLKPSEMKESTISISNFGVLGGGGMWATPIINYPEVAILGIARIHKQPVVRNGEIVIHDILNLSWSFDHRVIDGDLAATVSHYFSTLLQNPAPLIS